MLLYALVLHTHYAYAEKYANELDYQALNKRALSGDAEAQYWMGRTYLEGRLKQTPDTLVAKTWLNISAENGNAHAQFQLAEMYVNGNGVRQAVKWYKKCALDSLSHLEDNLKAKLAYAEIIGKGLYGENTDVKTAIKLISEIQSDTYLFNSAKTMDKWLAMKEQLLGDLYKVLTAEIYPSDWPDANLQSVRHYKNAIGLWTDWYNNYSVTNSEKVEYTNCVASSYYNCGDALYSYNIITHSNDQSEVMQLYQTAIDYGSEDATLEMGERLLTGFGNISADPEKAINLLLPLVDKNIHTKVLLAGYYYKDKQFQKAYNYYNDIVNEKTEINSYYRADAYSHLEKMYRFGYGVKQDKEKEKFCHERAAELGDSDAIYLDKLNFFDMVH
jgi:TPR repeat protein